MTLPTFALVKTRLFLTSRNTKLDEFSNRDSQGCMIHIKSRWKSEYIGFFRTSAVEVELVFGAFERCCERAVAEGGGVLCIEVEFMVSWWEFSCFVCGFSVLFWEGFVLLEAC